MLRKWAIHLTVLAGFLFSCTGLPGGGTGLWGPSPVHAAASKKKHRHSKEQPPKKHHHKKKHHKKHHHKKKKSGSKRVEGMNYRSFGVV